MRWCGLAEIKQVPTAAGYSGFRQRDGGRWIIVRRAVRFTFTVLTGLMVSAAAIPAPAETGPSSNFVPELSLAYTDPESGERFECGEDCRRFTVPAGVELEVRIQVHDEGGAHDGDGVTWDLWFNQPNHPFPGFDLAACFDAEAGHLDRGCWQAMLDRVDRGAWDTLVPDTVCVPGRDGGSCWDATIPVMLDPDFEGARRRGVYHFAVWVNRFAAVPEDSEFDNFAGPIRVTVEPRSVESNLVGGAPAVTGGGMVEASPPSPAVFAPSSPRPYGLVIVPEELETAVSLTSMRSQSLVEITPAYAGEVTVEVVQTGVFENMVVQVLKVSTGQVLIEASGKGSLRLEGVIDNFDLKDDCRFEVVVVPGQGSRGIRGSIRVSYPARLRYMVDRANPE